MVNELKIRRYFNILKEFYPAITAYQMAVRYVEQQAINTPNSNGGPNGRRNPDDNPGNGITEV